MESFNKATSQTKLKEFDASDKLIDDNSLNILLNDNKLNFTHFDALDLSCNKISSKGVEILLNFDTIKHLKKINISNNKIDEKGIEILINFAKDTNIEIDFRGNHGIFAHQYNGLSEHLDLSGLKITNENIPELIQFLKKHNDIVSLDLSNNLISDEGIIILCDDYLSKQPKIKKLNIRHNSIDIYGMLKLSENTTLNYIDVRENIGIEPKLELNQQWFISFLNLSFINYLSNIFFHENPDKGQCAGVCYTLIPKLNNPNLCIKEVIRFNVACKQLFDIYKALSENLIKYFRNNHICIEIDGFGRINLGALIRPEEKDGLIYEQYKKSLDDIGGNYFHTIAYKKEFIPKLKNEIRNWYQRLNKIQKEQYGATIIPLLDTIYVRQIAHEISSEDAKKNSCIQLKELKNIEDLLTMLNELRKNAKQEDIHFSTILLGNGHATSLTYVPSLDTFLYVDSNRLPIKFFDRNDVLADWIFKSHALGSSKLFSLDSDVYFLKEYQKKDYIFDNYKPNYSIFARIERFFNNKPPSNELIIHTLIKSEKKP